jgi:hypothetical protein
MPLLAGLRDRFGLGYNDRVGLAMAKYTRMHRTRFAVLVGMILSAAAFRLIPHPPNFAPVGALALFGGACFPSKRVAFLVPLAAMLVSDVAIGLLSGDLSRGLHGLLPVVYGSFALIVCLGFWLRRRRTSVPIAGAALASSVIFFLLTNFAIWALGSSYPKTWDGLAACYLAAIPFFHNTLLGDAFYVTVLFGGLALAEKRWPSLRERELAAAR